MDREKKIQVPLNCANNQLMMKKNKIEREGERVRMRKERKDCGLVDTKMLRSKKSNAVKNRK